MHAIPIQEVAGHCLQAFTQLVPASQAAFYCVDRQLQARDFSLHRMSGDMHRDYLDNYRQFDPLQPRNCLSSGLAVVPLGLAMARQPSRDSRRYRDFLQRYGVVDVVEILAHRAGPAPGRHLPAAHRRPGRLHRRSTDPTHGPASLAANGRRQYAAL